MNFLGVENLEIFVRLLTAMVLGAIIGVERSLAGKTAGMRTYSLVSMGAALFVIISEIMLHEFGGVASTDPLRMASQIVVGTGFIGAGLIIFSSREEKVKGLTTAAGIWVAAGVGSAVGFGLYLLAGFAVLLTIFVFSILWYIERYLEEKMGVGE